MSHTDEEKLCERTYGNFLSHTEKEGKRGERETQMDYIFPPLSQLKNIPCQFHTHSRLLPKTHTLWVSEISLSSIFLLLFACKYFHLSFFFFPFLSFAIAYRNKNIYNPNAYKYMHATCDYLHIILVYESVCVCFTWLRVAEYSGLTGRKGTALRSVTRVLWFWVVSHTGDTNMKHKNKSVCVCVCLYANGCVRSRTWAATPSTHTCILT